MCVCVHLEGVCTFGGGVCAFGRGVHSLEGVCLRCSEGVYLRTRSLIDRRRLYCGRSAGGESGGCSGGS